MQAILLSVLFLSFLSACSTGFDPNECRAPKIVWGYDSHFERPEIASLAFAQQLRSQTGVVCTYVGIRVSDTSFGQRYRFVRVPTGETIWSFDPDVLLRSGEYPRACGCVCVDDATFLLSCSFGTTMRYYFLTPATQRIHEVQFAGIAGRAWKNERDGIVEDPLITLPDGRRCMMLESGTLLVDVETGRIVDSANTLPGQGKNYISTSVDGKRILSWSPGYSNKDQLFINDVRIDSKLFVTSHDDVALRADGMQLASIRYMNVAPQDAESDVHVIIERWDCSDLASIRRIASVDVTAATCRYARGMPIAITPDGNVITTAYRTADLSGYDIITINATDNTVRAFR
ncbi:MAG: hypothetical protein JSS89_02070 [Bacteroidetes bacterium]|nr:hypothetical protein [Bacteroidota bacterium]